MGKPGLDVLPGGATGIARRQQIDVDGSAFAHRSGPRLPVRQVRERREVMRLHAGRASTGIPAGVLVTSHFPSIGSMGEFGVGCDHRRFWTAGLSAHEYFFPFAVS
jgi:hypothetical protein